MKSTITIELNTEFNEVTDEEGEGSDVTEHYDENFHLAFAHYIKTEFSKKNFERAFLEDDVMDECVIEGYESFDQYGKIELTVESDIKHQEVTE